MSLSVVSVPDTVSHCGNEISCELQTSLPITTANLRIVCYLQVEVNYGSGTFDIITSQTLTPDTNGRCKFYWNRHLWDTFANNFDLPTYQGTSEFLLEHFVKKYVLWAVELSGDPQTTTDLLNSSPFSDVRYAVRGSIPPHRLKTRSFFGVSGWNLLDVSSGGLGKAFLDWRGSNPRTRLSSDQWLYWFWQDPGSVLGAIPVQYRVKYYRSDGQCNEFTFLTTPTVNVYECYGFPAGFAQLGLSSYETSTHKITKYETVVAVQVLGNWVELSERKLWEVDRSYRENHGHISYLNSLGVVCQFQTLGAPTLGMAVSKDEHPRHFDQSQDLQNGESLVTMVEVQDSPVVTTGVLTFAEAKQYRELIASRKVMVNDRHGQFIPLRVKSRKVDIRLQENLYDYTLDISYDYTSEAPDHLQTL